MQLRSKPVAPPEPPPKPVEMPPDLAAVDVALLALEAERASVCEALDAIPTQERQLLDGDAGDDEFASLDLTKRRHERTLERLDVREGQLVALAEKYCRAAQLETYLTFRQQYIAAAEQLARTAEEAHQRIAAVNAISAQAARGGFPALTPVGFSQAGNATIFEHHLAVMANQLNIARALPAELHSIVAKPTYHIRFLQWTPVGNTAYQRGQVAAFTGKVARQLVTLNKAEYVEKKKGSDEMDWVAMWGSGPAPQTPPPKVTEED